ncbi:MAG: AMP-binding protein, partial [Planctomycetia bacterium]
MTAAPTTFTGAPATDVAAPELLTMGAFLATVAGRYGSAEAVVLDDPLRDGATVRWSYDDVLASAQRIGRGLVAAGVEPGAFVAILMGNRPESIAAIFGAAMVGAVAAPMSTFATRAELRQLLDLCAPSAVLTQASLLGRDLLDDVADASTALSEVRVTAAVGTPQWETLVDGGRSVTDAAFAHRCDAVRPTDPALVIFSSGTTGAPKGVLHTHRAPTLQFWVQAGVFGRDATTRMFSALPIFWTAGLNTAVGATLAAGGCWVAQETFDARTALPLLARERVTEPYTLPHQTAAIAEQPEWLATDLSAIRCASGKGAYARHPVVRPDPSWIMPVGYGMSETCAFVAGYASTESREQVRLGHGRLLPGTRLRVLDPESGTPLGPGQAGELAVAGDTLMLGYLGRDPASCFDEDGWFH